MEWNFAVYLCCGLSVGLGVEILRDGQMRKGISFRSRWKSSGRRIAANMESTWERLKKRSLNQKTSLFFHHWKKFATKRSGEKVDMEIYEAISFLRNTAALGFERIGNTDSIIEKLSEKRGCLQPIFLKMLQYLRMNQKEEAIRFFGEEAGTPIGKDFGRLLIQWDEISPHELSETLLSHQKSVKETRVTILKRRDEIISDLIYLPVILNVMLIFINFIYVAYFIDQKDMLSILF